MSPLDPSRNPDSSDQGDETYRTGAKAARQARGLSETSPGWGRIYGSWFESAATQGSCQRRRIPSVLDAQRASLHDVDPVAVPGQELG
jgi:hypothetical protein